MTSVSTQQARPDDPTLDHARQVCDGERFEFGRNWSSFLKQLDDDRIERARTSLAEMLTADSLEGLSFLDIGSGSGLFSLAARKMGARVVSFDFDPDSVACTSWLRERYFPGDENWTIQHGSVLDASYMNSLGMFDVVYSWGVLHHTGDMWNAIARAADRVADQGLLFIAIYNDTGSQSKRWRWIKSTYCKLPRVLKPAFAIAVSAPEETKRIATSLLGGKPLGYIKHWREYRNARGMSRWHDVIDWVGGYPYEYAGPSKLLNFLGPRGYQVVSMKCDNVGLGCNEMVFRKLPIVGSGGADNP